ncbi:MAG: hypothetical protein BECKG1743D_GA0114223_100898 [Candidatus Kentron sp. G]|nr:MAG: hypothetical protein BECKG1743F_GA0114225_100619 [Candidatus Kentron sp. G]VFM96462.1 MAG: hypothetical protein BECKG1743E_GA0114224_100629 [Candidatus Kentron sp. G]VFM98891.1 MAG: hypothetical protein BECKG1743D_GA0114223_100898 [Candidatus Kentron sp. G]
MTSIPFDTHGFVDTLRKSGVDEKQAIAHKDALCDASFATGADLRGMEQRIELDIVRCKLDIVEWMIGVALAQTALIIGLMNLFLKSA